MYEELAPKTLYSKLKKYIKGFDLYFPDYQDTPNYLPSKKFMWDVFATLDYDMASTFVDNSMEARANQKKELKKSEIQIDPEIYKQFMENDYLSKRKGKVSQYAILSQNQ